MMKYRRFVEELGAALQQELGEEFIVGNEMVTKENNQQKEALVIGQTGGCLRMVIYPESVYQQYQENGYMTDCVDILRKQVEEHRNGKPEVDKLLYQIKDWEKIKTHIYPRLVSGENNTEYLKDCVTDRYLDFTVYYAITWNGQDSESMCVRVKNSMLKDFWGITEAMFKENALNNFAKEQYHIVPMVQMFMELGICEEEENDNGMYILTNSRKSFGAIGILRHDLLEELADKLQEDLFLIPSSVHEWLVLPVGQMAVENINAMIKEVNQTQVLPEERLSDKAYYYDRESSEIRIAG